MTPPSLAFRLLALFPADHAENVGGKLYANGAYWDRLNFPGYPQVVPAISLVAVLEVPFAEYHSEHTFAFGMEDPDGKALPLKIEGSFRVGAGPDMEYGDPTVMPISVHVQNVLIESPGYYSFTFGLDGEVMGRYRIRAMQTAVPLQFRLAPPPPTPDPD